VPDDQGRSGPFEWPPPKENYVYEALQGALLQAVVLNRAGYDTWNWEDKALLRAFNWLYDVADYPAPYTDESWLPLVINQYYATNFPTFSVSRHGKNMTPTCWTHQAQP
jgi:hypothetical protein